MNQNVTVIRSLGGFVFDGVFQESHESELEVTENPVETGVVIADHAFMKPLKVTITAGVSDTPLYVAPDDPFSTGTRRSVTAMALLQQLQASAELFRVVTGLRVYDSMVCLRVTAITDKDTDAVFMFEATLRELQLVSTQVVTYPPREQGATSRKASAKKQKGEQQGEQVTDPTKKSSIASKLLRLLAGPPKPGGN